MKRLLQKRFSMIETVGLSALVVLSVAVAGYAVTTVPNTFTSGATISSSAVNANFTALAGAIDRVTTCAGNSPGDAMVKVGPLCVDKYEASIWQNADGTGTAYGLFAGQSAYPAGFPANGNWTTPVYAVSKAGALPSSNVTWFQAQQACVLSGKRLLTNAEWQMAAAGTPDPGTDNGTTDCAVNSANTVNTGARSKCVSIWQVNDMVGNVWEWIADWMQGDTTSWAPSTGTAGTEYGEDFMYGTNPAIVQGTGATNFPAALFRGGYWNSGSHAGVFALFANSGPAYADITIGFRCAR